MATLVATVNAALARQGWTLARLSRETGVPVATLRDLLRDGRVGAEALRSARFRATLRLVLPALGLDPAPWLPAPTSWPEAIRQALETHNLTHAWLAAQVGVHRGTISNLLLGRRPLHPSHLAAIRRVLPGLPDSLPERNSSP